MRGKENYFEISVEYKITTVDESSDSSRSYGSICVRGAGGTRLANFQA
jgi:hypothetical protein